MKQIFLLLLAAAALITILGVLNKYPEVSKEVIQNPGGFLQTSVQKSVYDKKELKIGEKTILVEVVDTQASRNKGLSGRDSLDSEQGMLFDFGAQDVNPGFWMKDMKFSIDIIWINDNRVAQISKNVPFPEPNTPDRSLPIYTSQGAIDYVLEVVAGFSDQNNIQVGDGVDLSSALAK